MFDLIAQAMAAWNQVGLLIGGGFLAAIGALLLGNRLYWRLGAARVSGRVIGVRPTQKGTYYPVYRYVSSTGETIEATSDTASNLTSRMQTGLQARLLVFDRNPRRVADADSCAVEIIAAALLVVSGALIYFALSTWPVTRVTWTVLSGTALYAVYRLRAWMRPPGGQLSLSAWRGSKEQQLEAIPMRPLEEIAGTADMTEQPGRQRKLSPAFAPILAIVGIVLIAFGLHLGRALMRLQTDGLRATGMVVRLQPDSDVNNDSTYHPVVRFSTRDGSPVEFKDRVGSNPPAYRTDDAVTVLYLPDSPQASAMIDRGSWNWLPPAALCLFGILLTAGGIQMRRRRDLGQSSSSALT